MPKQVHHLIEGLAERDAEFYKALQNEDDLGLVVRGQIHIEHELQQMVLAIAPQPEQAKFNAMTFTQTLRVALILGLSPEFESALSAVGRLRNRFAHRLGFQLTEKEASEFYAAIGSVAKEVTEKAYENLIQKNPDAGHPETLSDLSARDQVSMILTSIRGGILAERLRLQRLLS